MTDSNTELEASKARLESGGWLCAVRPAGAFRMAGSREADKLLGCDAWSPQEMFDYVTSPPDIRNVMRECKRVGRRP